MSWPKGKPWNEARRASYVKRDSWNKGREGVSPETRRKMRERKLGKPRAKITKQKNCLSCASCFTMTNNKQKFCLDCSKLGHAGRYTLYGMSRQTFEEMLREQKNLCKLCSKTETQKTSGTLRDLSVDHDHSTGKVRGLLCSRCNLYIVGSVTIEVAEKLLRYLKGEL